MVSTEQSTCKMTPENLVFLPNLSLNHFLFYEILPPARLAVNRTLPASPKMFTRYVLRVHQEVTRLASVIRSCVSATWHTLKS